MIVISRERTNVYKWIKIKDGPRGQKTTIFIQNHSIYRSWPYKSKSKTTPYIFVSFIKTINCTILKLTRTFWQQVRGRVTAWEPQH